MRVLDKDLRKVVKALEAQEFTVRRTRKGHLAVTKDGQHVTVFAGTTSDQRSLRNGIAAARRAGFEWPPKR